MINFIIMAVCLIMGLLIRRLTRVTDVRPLNIVILWVSLPALVFTSVPGFFRGAGLTSELVWAVATPWFNFLVALAVIVLAARVFHWSRSVVGALVLTAGLGNTSFVGIPVIDALYGPEGVRIAILIDQLGTFLILATLGLVVASVCAGRDVKASHVVRRVLTFPPFLSLVLAAAWGLSSVPIDGLAVEACRKIGATLVPLALLSVGWQMKWVGADAKKLAFGLGFKLIAWPLIACLILKHFTTGLVFDVSVMEAAMAPMITGAVVAADFGLEPELAQLMVGIGIPLSALSLWFVHTLI